MLRQYCYIIVGIAAFMLNVVPTAGVGGGVGLFDYYY